MTQIIFINLLDAMLCNPGYCGSPVSNAIVKTRFEVEHICSNDARCLAIDYSTDLQQGHLCGSPHVSYGEQQHDYVFCRKGKVFGAHINKCR